MQDVSGSVSWRGGDSDHHHLKLQKQMADTVSDPGLFVPQSSVCCITAGESEDDGHLYGTWGELHMETTNG